jgi:hypothetical protein
MTVHKATLSLRDVEDGFRKTVGGLVFDRERGFNHWAGTEDSVMLVWASRIYEFLVVLESVLSYPPARGFCREVGYRSGHEGAVATLKGFGGKSGRRVEGLLAMSGVLAGAGWGLGELVYDDTEGEVRWTFPRGTAVGVAARRAGRRKTPACAFFEGFGAGWAKGSVGADLEMMEIECIGQGDDACRFESRALR